MSYTNYRPWLDRLAAEHPGLYEQVIDDDDEWEEMMSGRREEDALAAIQEREGEERDNGDY